MSNIDPISTATAATTPSAVENPGAVLDRDAFLKLLVAQLKFQDPTSPADTSQLVTQSAQLTMVDRLNDIAVALEDAAATDRLSIVGSLVGRDVSFSDENGFDVTARVDSVRFDHGELTILAGGFLVPLAGISEVIAPPVTAPPVAASAVAVPTAPDDA